jgi:hypothetical protein
MPFSVETVNRLLASGRNYISTTVGFVGGIGLMSAAQQKGVSDAFIEIFNGLSQIVHGATSLWGILVVAFPAIGFWMAKMASNSAKVTNQAPAVLAAVKDPATPISPETKTAIIAAATEVVKQ